MYKLSQVAGNAPRVMFKGKFKCKSIELYGFGIIDRMYLRIDDPFL